MPHQAGARHAVATEHFLLEPVLVDAAGDQPGGHLEGVGEYRIGKIVGVGHHSHVKRFGAAETDAGRVAGDVGHRQNDPEQKFAGGGNVDGGEHRVETLGLSRDVVVDQHFAGLAGEDVFFQVFRAGEPVEVEADDQVGAGDQPPGGFGFPLTDDDMVFFRHGLQESHAFGVGARQDHMRLFSTGLEVMPGSRHAAHRIAVGIEMPDEDDVARL